MTGEIVTRTARYSLGADGIIRSTNLPGARETLADAEENLRVLASLAGGSRRPLLADVRLLRDMNREARVFYGRPEFARVLSASAVVVGSPVTRTLINFILVMYKPRYPIRLFTSETEALAWLRSLSPGADAAAP